MWHNQNSTMKKWTLSEWKKGKKNILAIKVNVKRHVRRGTTSN